MARWLTETLKQAPGDWQLIKRYLSIRTESVTERSWFLRWSWRSSLCVFFRNPPVLCFCQMKPMAQESQPQLKGHRNRRTEIGKDLCPHCWGQFSAADYSTDFTASQIQQGHIWNFRVWPASRQCVLSHQCLSSLHQFADVNAQRRQFCSTTTTVK